MTYEAKIKIPKSKLETYELMFSYGKEDLIKYEIPCLENIKTWTCEFENGFVCDIKINTSEDDVWSEAVLFDKNNGYCELTHTDVCDSLSGKWELEYNGDIYNVIVEGI